MNRTDTLRELLLLLQGVLLGFAAYSYVKYSERNRQVFFRTWLTIGLLSALASLALFYLADPTVSWNLQPPTNAANLLAEQLRLGSPFWGPSNYYASILLLFVPMAGAAFILGYNRAFAAITGTVMAVTLFLTTSRGAVLAMIVAGLYLGGVFLKQAMRRQRQLVFGLALVGLVLLAIAGPSLVNYFFLSRDASIGSLNGGTRGALLRTAFRFVPAHLLVGAGFGASPALAPSLMQGTHVYALTLLLELGLPGLLLGIVVAVRVLRILGQAARTHRGKVDAAVVIVWASFASLALTLVNIQVEASLEGVVFFWVFGALMGAAYGGLATRAAH
ncbi:MAG: O-antigen ligase family protein [Solirubrobacteraceae bacterium]